MRTILFRMLQALCVAVLLAVVLVESLWAILIEDSARMEDQVHRP